MTKQSIKKFDRHVGLKFHLFNSLFLRLPFDLIQQTGIMLPLLSSHCQEQFKKGASPKEIIDSFFEEFMAEAHQDERMDLLFNLIKYIERQVVLFDAVEDAAFQQLHDSDGKGTVNDLLSRVSSNQLQEAFQEKLNDYKLRVVLTAHPTQFYPGTVLGIITDLSGAIEKNNLAEVNDLLLQLGKTPFINREKPTPLDEARSLIWFLRKVFYEAIPDIIGKIEKSLPAPLPRRDLIDLGFWPGGDRDGNPFVTSVTTLETAFQLRKAILGCYEADVQKLRRRLTFRQVYDQVSLIGKKIHGTLFNEGEQYESASALHADLMLIREVLEHQHDNLFAEDLEEFIRKVEIFGFHFASIDIRQDSGKHEKLLEEIILKKTDQKTLDQYLTMSVPEKMNFLDSCTWRIDASLTENDISIDIITSIQAIREIQTTNGEYACHRYIISHARNALDVFSIYILARWINGSSFNTLDIVPLFESIDDLATSGEVMEMLYQYKPYAQHLKARHNKQTVMLGFSDGTKDGGYLKANWSIFICKEALTKVSRAHKIKVVFFDGRGGPPARGGGNTHKFYAAQGSGIENKELQLTIQGQTISSNFGSKNIAIHNLEQLFTAGVENSLFPNNTPTITPDQRKLLEEMADEAYQAYIALKTNPDFLPYLRDNGTLSYYGESNIGSRPDKRNKGGALSLDNLRAIPFVGSWSQLKQNVPGYYGFGAALEKLKLEGRANDIAALYDSSKSFQTLVGNSVQSMAKSFFPLTAYLEHDPQYGSIWKMIYEEFQLAERLLLELTQESKVNTDLQANRESIQLREDIVLPLLTIQQYALLQLKELSDSDTDQALKETYRKMITRTMPGIINAARNSA